MTKYLNLIDLNKKYIFYSFIIVIVFILTYVNNYFFYNYVEIRDKQEIIYLSKTIHYKLNNCNESLNECIIDIDKYLLEIKPYIEMNILNFSNNEILKYKNIKERHLDRKIVELPSNLSENFKFNIKINISKYSSPIIFITTFKSMTFSIQDIVMEIYKNGLSNTYTWYMKEAIYLRSLHVVAFIIFTIFLMKLLQFRQLKYNNQLNEQNMKIVKLGKDLENSKEIESELKNLIDDLKTKDINLLAKMEEYNSVINPPIDLLKYNDIMSLDPESIIFKCRKVLEKLISEIYIKNIGNTEYKTLDVMIKELQSKKLLNKKASSYAYTIKAFGNISAHPDFRNPFEFTQNDAKIISNALILFIEELNIDKI